MYLNAARLQYSSKNYAEAAQLIDRAFTFYKANPEGFSQTYRVFEIMNGLNTLALSYMHLKRYDESLTTFEKAKRLAVENHNEFWINLITGNTGQVYYDLGRSTEALEACMLDYKTSFLFSSKGSTS